MPNGGHQPSCANCTSREEGPRRSGHCARHQFVIPDVDDFVICRDWQPALRTEPKPGFVDFLEPGVLYRWREYHINTPRAFGGFDELREFRLDRRWGLYENPVNGWSVQLARWDHELFPAPGQPLEMHLDTAAVPFAVRDAPVTTTHTGRSASGELKMEDRTAVTRILRPAEGHEARLVSWIERHYELDKERHWKAENLRDPRHMYKDNVLKLSVRIIGAPDRGYYELLASPGELGRRLELLSRSPLRQFLSTIKSLFS